MDFGANECFGLAVEEGFRVTDGVGVCAGAAVAFGVAVTVGGGDVKMGVGVVLTGTDAVTVAALG